MDTAVRLGIAIGQAGFALNYGGGKQGVMGAAAIAAHAAGAAVTAFALAKYSHETQIEGATVIPVADEAARFDAMTRGVSAMIALPGGPGSMRETLQGLEKAVYENGAPVILAHAGDYLTGISDYFRQAVQTGLIGRQHALKLCDWRPGTPLASLVGKPPLP